MKQKKPNQTHHKTPDQDIIYSKKHPTGSLAQGDNDPKRYAENFRSLIHDKRAVAIINCFGDENCKAASELALQEKVPLIGLFSGLRSLREPKNPVVFNIRPSYDKEAQALLHQLYSMGIYNVAVVTDKNPEAEQVADMKAAARDAGVALAVTKLDTLIPAQFAARLAELKAHGVQAIIFELSLSGMDALGVLDEKQRKGIPLIAAGISSAKITELSRALHGKTIVFTSVVPNPEQRSLPIISEIQINAESVDSGNILTFDGIESYINTRVAIEAISVPALNRRQIVLPKNSMV